MYLPWLCSQVFLILFAIYSYALSPTNKQLVEKPITYKLLELTPSLRAYFQFQGYNDLVTLMLQKGSTNVYTHILHYRATSMIQFYQ